MVDLPAILPCVDSQLIWHLIDQFVFVIEWGKTSRDLVEECLSRGYLDRGRMLGAMLNKVDPRVLRRYA